MIHLTILNTDDKFTINGREIYSQVGIKSHYNSWILRGIKNGKLIESEDFKNHQLSGTKYTHINALTQEYMFTPKGAEKFCNAVQSVRAKEITFNKDFIAPQGQLTYPTPLEIMSTEKVKSKIEQLELLEDLNKKNADLKSKAVGLDNDLIKINEKIARNKMKKREIIQSLVKSCE